MKLNIELEITDVYGGDGITRIKEVESMKLDRTKKTKTTKREYANAGPQERVIDEQKTELKQVEVNTFQTDEKNNPILRLGGVHGKFWGTMKQAGHLLSEFEGKAFASKTAINNFMTMVNISPTYTPLKCNGDMKEIKLPQILNTMGRSMVESYFDVIPKCTVELELEFPDTIKDKVMRMLEQVQKMASLNKRRSMIKILNWDDISN